MSIRNYTRTDSSYFNSSNALSIRTVTLIYPNLNEEVIYIDEYSLDEIIDTINCILKYCVLMSPVMKIQWFKDVYYVKWQLGIAKIEKDLASFACAVQTFNIKIKKAIKQGLIIGNCGSTLPQNLENRMNSEEYNTEFAKIHTIHSDLILHIYNQSYKRTIAPIALCLTEYEPFSDGVYGEVNFNFVLRMISAVNLKRKDIFIDLGCGIGNVLCQVAGITQCTCYGIEMMNNVANLGLELKSEFKKRMSCYNQYCGYIQLLKGDIFEHQGIVELLKQATVVFVNNAAFSPELNAKLEELFWFLQDGSTIVSLNSFVRLRKDNRNIELRSRINDRSIEHIECILHLQEMTYCEDDVSWTNAPGSYFIQRVDRQPLIAYFKEIAAFELQNENTLINVNEDHESTFNDAIPPQIHLRKDLDILLESNLSVLIE